MLPPRTRVFNFLLKTIRPSQLQCQLFTNLTFCQTIEMGPRMWPSNCALLRAPTHSRQGPNTISVAWDFILGNPNAAAPNPSSSKGIHCVVRAHHRERRTRMAMRSLHNYLRAELCKTVKVFGSRVLQYEYDPATAYDGVRLRLCECSFRDHNLEEEMRKSVSIRPCEM
jgi:hypothetical protein